MVRGLYWYSSVAPLRVLHVPSQYTGIMAGTGLIPHNATLVNLICPKLFHRQCIGHRHYSTGIIEGPLPYQDGEVSVEGLSAENPKYMRDIL